MIVKFLHNRSSSTNQFSEEEKAVAKKEKEERKAAENERKAAEKAEKENKRKSVELEGEGKPERKSLLSRLASKRKSRNVTKDEADEATAAAAATGATTSATVVATDHATDATKSAEVPEVTRSSAEDVEVVGDPISPIRTRDSAALATKPDLERHITNIETSSESESDNDEVRTRKREKKQKSALLASTSTAKPDAVEHVPATEEVEAPFVVSPVRTRSVDEPVAPGTASTTATKSTGESAIPTDKSSTMATKSIADRAVSSPVDAPRESTASSRPDVEKEKAQDSKRIRGFFSKLRNRQSSKAAERQPGSFSSGSGKAAADKETTTVVPAAAAATSTSTDPRAASPSSFDRHRATDDDEDLAPAGRKSLDVSSLSSSGLDEDDLQDGRTGRQIRALGGKEPIKSDAAGTDVLPTTEKGIKSDDDSDQFEEARDHFDEGLAPRPSFAGQAKSASPARETKFHEEV